MNQNDSYPCVCCGHLVLSGPPGSHQICPICGWQDDEVQLRWPTYSGGANRPSLVEAQASYKAHGATDGRSRMTARKPGPDEFMEPGFRNVDPATDNFEPVNEISESWPEDRSVLYWWRPTYWRRPTDDASS